MIKAGVDYSAGAEHWSAQKCASMAAALKAANRFAARYLGTGWGSGKGLTVTEFTALKNAGVPVVFILEYGTQDSLGGATVGKLHADKAKAELTKLGIDWHYQPVIYCTDTDAHIDKVGPYYRELVNQMGLSNVWAYGGYFLVKELFDAKLISGAMQAKAWSTAHPVTGVEYYGAGRVIKWEARAQIRQHGEGTTVVIDGTNCNDDAAYFPYYGQYPAPGVVTPPPTPVTPPYPNKVNLEVKDPYMRDGANGITGVKKIQQKLISLGFSCGPAKDDGIYGKDTAAAVTAWKKKLHPELTVPGVVGPETWAALFKA